MTLAADLVARLAKEGIDPNLLAEVAQELFAGEIERKALADRRHNERVRKAGQRIRSRDVTGQAGTGTEVRGQTPQGSPKDNTQTPSSPPVEVSEAEASSPQPRPWALPAGVGLQVWTDFLANRKRKRLGQTPTAWKAFNDDLKRISAQTGIPPPELIRQCTAKGWGAIYDPSERTNGNERPDNPTAIAVQRLTGAFGASH